MQGWGWNADVRDIWAKATPMSVKQHLKLTCSLTATRARLKFTETLEASLGTQALAWGPVLARGSWRELC